MMDDRTNPKDQVSTEKVSKAISIIYEFYIDLLGSLVPGLFTTVVALATVGWSLLLLCNAIQNSFQLSSQSEHRIDDIARDFHGEIAVIILVTSYILGSIFFRRDPKTPDARSAWHIWKLSTPEERKRLAVQETTGKGGKKDFDSQFPYLFLYEYLVRRGLEHLAYYVPWQGSDGNTHFRRTKMFINILKIRLYLTMPDKCRDIIRNEAQVRLATSVWYASTWLKIASLVAILLVGLSWAIVCIAATDVGHACRLAPKDTLMVLFVNVLVFLVTVVMKNEIEKFIHYMRVREVLYVLETAHFAKKLGIDLAIEELLAKENDPKSVNK